jgi:hypothetical protein
MEYYFLYSSNLKCFPRQKQKNKKQKNKAKNKTKNKKTKQKTKQNKTKQTQNTPLFIRP